VGGQRNERRKWIRCFEDVTAIIFVAAISEYDQTLYEDATQNRLVESLKLFGEVCGLKCFEDTSIILFLNKRDLLAQKLAMGIDLRQPNPNPFGENEKTLFDYIGGCNYDLAVDYLLGRFLEQNKDPKREIYWHVTCATDTSNVETVLSGVKETILRQNLISGGVYE
jgi:hypothetical protein